MFCKNRITLIGFLGHDAESRSTSNGTVFTRLSLATSMSWKEKGSNEYKTRTEWHRILCWNKLADWAGTLQKGAYVKSKASFAIANTHPRNPIAACAWRRFMPTRSWRWTARIGSPFLPLNQSQPTNCSTNRVYRAAIFIIAARSFFQSAFLVRTKKNTAADPENVSVASLFL